MSLGNRGCSTGMPHDKSSVPDVPLHLVGRARGFLDVELFLPVTGNACGIGTPISLSTARAVNNSNRSDGLSFSLII